MTTQAKTHTMAAQYHHNQRSLPTMEKSLAAIERELNSLNKLESRVKQTVNPSQVLLREIEKRRQELLNPEKSNAPAQAETRK